MQKSWIEWGFRLALLALIIVLIVQNHNQYNKLDTIEYILDHPQTMDVRIVNH